MSETDKEAQALRWVEEWARRTGGDVRFAFSGGEWTASATLGEFFFGYRTARLAEALFGLRGGTDPLWFKREALENTSPRPQDTTREGLTP